MLPYITYGFLALLILGPLLLPGYVLTLDMVFVPHPPMPAEVTNTYIYDVLLHFVSLIIPGDIVQKLFLVALFFAAGFGAHHLVAYLYKNRALAAYTAGLFYVVNPFVYARFMAGQYLVLAGYALLPFFARALLVFLERPSLKTMWPALAWMLGISILSIHTIGLMALFAVVAIIVGVWRARDDRGHMLGIAKFGSLGVASFLLLSSYWLVPLALGQGTTATTIQKFDASDADAFATDGGMFYVAMLKGFWAEAQGLFRATDDILPLSGLMQLVVWGAIGIGVWHMWRRRPHEAGVFASVALIAATLAICQPLMNWLAAHVPLFAGYREPHKFVALVALAFAVFLGFGTQWLVQKVGGFWRAAVLGGLALVIFWNTPTMVWAGNGQLSPRQYPADWYQANQKIKGQTATTLFLPWHLYMPFTFTGGRTIANPAKKFFEAPVLVSDNVEFAGVTSHAAGDRQKIEKEILPDAPNRTDLGAQLAPLGIQYVLFAKESDATDYDYLAKQTDLQLVFDGPSIQLYENKAYHANN